MQRREKIAWAIAVLAIAIMISYFYVEKGRADARDKTLAELRTEKENLDAQIEELKKENEKLLLDIDLLNKFRESDAEVIADLQARQTPREVTRWRYLPPDCKKCMEENELPVTVTDDKEWVETHVRDAFHPEDGASIKFLPAFDRDVLAPARDQIKKCEGLLDDCQDLTDRATDPRGGDPEKPFSFESEHGVFVGTGYIGDNNLGVGLNYEGRFIRLGSRDGLNAQLGVNVGGMSPFDGRDFDVYGLVGGEVKW